MFTTTDPKTAIAHPGPVLIMQLEQYTLVSHLVAMARAAMGRRTAAMVFRAREALTGTRPQTRLKRFLLRAERKMSPVTMMTILPLDLLPNADTLFRSWLHDPQVWDIPYLQAPAADRGLAERALTQAKGRRIIVALGLMESYKGVETLATLVKDATFCSQYLLVIAGMQLPATRPFFESITSDCLIENRYISDGELYSLYDIADFVWSVYAPDYDQASGIFGRAIQFGRTPIIREGSLIDGYARYLAAPAIRIPWQARPDEIARRLGEAPGKVPPTTIGNTVSAENLMTALYP